MILEDATLEAFGYEIWELSIQSNRPIWTACTLCGELRVPKRIDYKTFCKSCVKKGKKLTAEHKQKIAKASEGRKHTEEVKTQMSKARKGTRLGNKNPSWTGGPVKRVCRICGNGFEVKRYTIKNGYGKYCSRSCAAIAGNHRSKGNPTKPEKKFAAICIKYNLPFLYNCRGPIVINRATPDFVHKTKKIVVEVFGDFWHSPLLRPTLRDNETLEGRKAQLEAEGYTLIVFWESDLMREDAEKFVMHKLRGEKII